MFFFCPFLTPTIKSLNIINAVEAIWEGDTANAKAINPSGPVNRHSDEPRCLDELICKNKNATRGKTIAMLDVVLIKSQTFQKYKICFQSNAKQHNTIANTSQNNTNTFLIYD